MFLLLWMPVISCFLSSAVTEEAKRTEVKIEILPRVCWLHQCDTNMLWHMTWRFISADTMIKIWHINNVQSWSWCIWYATGSCMQLYLFTFNRLTDKAFRWSYKSCFFPPMKPDSITVINYMLIVWFMSWNTHIWHSTVCDVQKSSSCTHLRPELNSRLMWNQCSNRSRVQPSSVSGQMQTTS